MNFLELVQSRRSVRAFKQNNISNEILIQLIEAASFAPSGGNCQPWYFYIVKDINVKTEIINKSCHQNWMLTAPVFIVVCADIKQSENRYGERGRNLYSLQDTAAAIQNLLLCAASLGLGTCWCGAFDEYELRNILGLQKDMRPVAIIPVGYSANEPVMPKRKPLDEIITFIGEDNTVDLKEENINKFEHCDMGGTIFNDVNLGSSVFSNINFCNVDISDANLSNGQIYECNLSNFKIFDSKLDGMTINGRDICELLEK